MSKRAGLAIAAAAAALIVVLLTAPAFVDWNRYRGEVADRIEEALGRRVAIDGSVSLRLLPVPALSVNELRLVNIDGAVDADMVRLPSLSLRLRPLALLTGRIEVASLVLVGPEVHLEQLADGRTNWQFKTLLPASRAGKSESPSRAVGAFLVDRLSVERGVIVLRRPNAEPVRIAEIDGGFIAQAAEGEYRGAGTMRAGGVDLGFEGALGATAGTMSVSLTVTQTRGGETAGSVRISGQLTGAGSQASFKGRVAAKGGDLKRLVEGVIPLAAPVVPAGSVVLR